MRTWREERKNEQDNGAWVDGREKKKMRKQLGRIVENKNLPIFLQGKNKDSVSRGKKNHCGAKVKR